MAQSLVLSKDETQRLSQFHRAHFPGQVVPSIGNTSSESTLPQTHKVVDEDDLGYYEDGTKRTLTDDQVAMFRNSEIQRIIQDRRRVEEKEAERKERQKYKQEQDTEERSTGSRTWTKHFDEAPEGVDTLMYDDEPGQASHTENGPKKFLWPKLG